MPYYAEGRLEPRPVTLRAFAMRTPSGWTVMPGGFARVGASRDTAAIAMRQGGRAADVWVLGEAPVERITLLPAREDEAVDAKLTAILPSRAADNLFWLGRYIERAEGTVRVLRAYHGRFAEASPSAAGSMLPMIDASLDEIGIDVHQPIPDALAASIDAAAASAGRIRDRFSPDGWLALMDLSKTVHRFRTRVISGDDASRAMTVLLRKLAGFAGLVHENMYHAVGWRFLEIGRRLERAIEMCRLMALLAPPGCGGRAARPAGRGRRQRHDPSPPLQAQFRAPRGHRAAGAGRVQSALDPLPARRGEGAGRHADRRRERRSHPSHHARGAAPLYRAADSASPGTSRRSASTRWPLRSPRCPT